MSVGRRDVRGWEGDEGQDCRDSGPQRAEERQGDGKPMGKHGSRDLGTSHVSGAYHDKQRDSTRPSRRDIFVRMESSQRSFGVFQRPGHMRQRREWPVGLWPAAPAWTGDGVGGRKETRKWNRPNPLQTPVLLLLNYFVK